MNDNPDPNREGRIGLALWAVLIIIAGLVFGILILRDWSTLSAAITSIVVGFIGMGIFAHCWWERIDDGSFFGKVGKGRFYDE